MKKVVLFLAILSAPTLAALLSREKTLEPLSEEERNLRAVYYYNAFPSEISNPFNMYSNYNIFNPNLSHVTA